MVQGSPLGRNTRTFTVLHETAGDRRLTFRDGLGVPECNSGLHAGRGSGRPRFQSSQVRPLQERASSTQAKLHMCCRNERHAYVKRQ